MHFAIEYKKLHTWYALTWLYSYTDIEDEEETETIVDSFDDLVSGWFKFVQVEDGSIPAVYHDNGEDVDVINIKKQITAAFQANFKGTGSRLEADPQSLHMVQYR